MPISHSLMGGKLHVYKRDDDARHWQCSAFFAGRNHRVSTKQEEFRSAQAWAEEWYVELRGKAKRGEVLGGKKFKHAAEQFEREYGLITEGQRNEQYVQQHSLRIKIYLLPFLGEKYLGEITAGLIQEYRIYRRNIAVEKWGKPPARNTMHQEMVTLRQVLKTALRHGWIDHLPDLSEPYRSNGKISHRAWFSPEEYKQLYEATRRRANEPKRTRWTWESEQLHDYVLFMANTGLRPDEANRLEYRDVEVVDDTATEERILLISVRGKRGVGYCKSMPGAVLPFQRLVKRNAPQPDDKVFPKGGHRQLFDTILQEEKLKIDREGQRRTAYSLRHTYICLRLMEGADIYQIAKNCRTSVEMIQKYYASHIANSLDTAAINVRRVKPAHTRVVEESTGDANV